MECGACVWCVCVKDLRNSNTRNKATVQRVYFEGINFCGLIIRDVFADLSK